MSGREKFRLVSRVDPLLAFAVMLLIFLGTVMVYSSSSLLGTVRFDDSAYYLKRHILHVVAGLSVMTLVFFVNVRGLRRLAVVALGVSAALLLATLFTPAGVEVKFAQRWLSLGGITLQPAEIVKPLLVLYAAAYLARKGEHIRDFARGLLPLLLTMGGILALILCQPDFGTCIVLAATIAAMIFVARARLRHMGILAVLAVGAIVALVARAPYRLRRVEAFINPWSDPGDKGFQIIQSFMAFQHGGVGGRGLGDGSQKLLHLPEAHTDFIYSVIGEELGLAGSLAVVGLFSLLVVQGLRLTMRIEDPFAMYLAFGLTFVLGIQAFLNMAVATGLVPTKGLTLPFVSYGGSSLLASFAAAGILFSLSAMVPAGMAKRKGS